MANGDGNGTVYKIGVGVITLIIVGFLAYIGSFVVDTKEALATNRREHQIFNEMARDIKEIKKDVIIIRAQTRERFEERFEELYEEP